MVRANNVRVCPGSWQTSGFLELAPRDAPVTKNLGPTEIVRARSHLGAGGRSLALVGVNWPARDGHKALCYKFASKSERTETVQRH